MAESYPLIAADLLSPILELLRLSRQHCGGDVDKFLVLLVVALRTRSRSESAGQQVMEGPPVLPGGTNGRSIAASLEIPNETVRRKVCELIEAGWLMRHGSRLFYTAKAHEELAPVREQIERLAVDCYRVVAGLRTGDLAPA